MNALSCVLDELLDVSHKWFNLGLKLQLSVGILERVRDQYSDPSTSLREMLLHWLKKVDPPPTWEGLACALESRTVGEPRLAEQLRTKYCKTEGATGQLLYITNPKEVISGYQSYKFNYPHCFLHVCESHFYVHNVTVLVIWVYPVTPQKPWVNLYIVRIVCY